MEWGFQLQLKIEKYGLHIRMWAIRAYFGEKNCRDRHFSNEMRILAVFVLPLVICLGRPFDVTNMTKWATVEPACVVYFECQKIQKQTLT